MKKIIVAGGGHGGIAAGMLLAEKGFDVTVYEQKSEGTLGYDWTDIFAPSALSAIGLPLPPVTQFEYKENMTFYGPSGSGGLRQDIPPEKLEIKMERRDIYKYLITNAEERGVKFVYDCPVLSPITAGDRVIGIKTGQGDVYGDLVIDACGLNSPLRQGLPESFGVPAEVGKNNRFYVYRAFYNKGSDEPVKDKYKVILFGEGILGVAWVATEENYTDLLVGRFEPFGLAEAERAAAYYRQENPSLGTELVRGGQFVEIPVRWPLAKLVANGYAAIGDAAYMTVPIIGSGIANSLKAARMLADTVLADADGAYSAATLWGYQRNYYQKLGNGFALLACVKEALTVFTPADLDYLFEHGVINARDMSIDADTTDIFSVMKKNTARDMQAKLSGVIKDPVLLKKMLRVGGKITALSAVLGMQPTFYNKATVDLWVRMYERAIAAGI
ncbi:MAG: tryptophan 7-halogenase [Clostridia bacterium]|nr:tryptophan 7-halogenase [Clostridia bacterium]